MPVGASKGFTVWTKANNKWVTNLLKFIIEKEFVTSWEIHTESMKKNPDSSSSKPHGVWGMKPDKHQIWNFLKCKCSWIVKSDKILITANPSACKGEKILWELAPNWEQKYIEYEKYMMGRADMLKETGTVKWQ